MEGDVKFDDDSLSLKQLSKSGRSGSPEQMEGLGQDCLTGRPNGWKAHRLSNCPILLGVALVQERNKKTAVSEDA